MTEHLNCDKYVIRKLASGHIDLSVCWDQANIRDIAAELREIADSLDEMPADTTGIGVKPL